MPFPSLPPELWLDIVDTIVLSNPSHALRTPALASLARISRSFYSVANPLLYRTLFLDTSRRLKILSTLAARPTLAKEVRNLTISGGEMSVGEFEFTKEVLSSCSNISSLTYLCFDSWYLPNLTSSIAKTSWSKQLRYLRSDAKEGLFELLSKLPNLEELVASRIDFPETSSISMSTSRPSFRLKRFDSGSTPFDSDFFTLTYSSRETLVDLDFPTSSRSPLPDLSGFPALSRLTLTLAERYIPHNLDSRIGVPGGPIRADRDDIRCLERVKEMLRMIEAGGGGNSFERLELYQPDYRRTREISSNDVKEAGLLEGIPRFVKELDLSTINLEAEYLMEVFGGRSKEGCNGLRRIWLRKVEQVKEVDRVLTERGIAVEWV
ncbi:uncharacterized protein JCM6883_001598 [Sporobolomyces salmoneus]|uniref:uncharacterized protein n=1 Tax=Sporobolomyces salmoneus TaxID=183962 RepID=UPI003182AC2A